MNRITQMWCGPLVALLVLACGGEETVAPVEYAPELAPEVTQSAPGDPLGFDHPPVDLPPTSRAIKRLTVQQLRNLLPVVAGPGISWTLRDGSQDVELLQPEALGRTLGEPDYVQVTHEAAEPTALYLKFMDDMARDVCTKMDEAGTLAPSADRDQNLADLKLRMLGERVPDADADAVADLAVVHDAGGYLAVCVALMTSPAFHLY
ncbi:MAG: hypothetical protein ACI9WU_002732 [Myxococcota bacterium]|jgi:hypothetical protein